MLLSKKTAVITGCNKGIGKAILEEFSKNGANIFACVRKVDKNFEALVEKLKKENNNQIFPIEIDLSDEENVKKGAKKFFQMKCLSIF